MVQISGSSFSIFEISSFNFCLLIGQEMSFSICEAKFLLQKYNGPSSALLLFILLSIKPIIFVESSSSWSARRLFLPTGLLCAAVFPPCRHDRLSGWGSSSSSEESFMGIWEAWGSVSCVAWGSVDCKNVD